MRGVVNWAWRDSGNRVGVSRLFDLFEEQDLPLTVRLSASDAIYERMARVAPSS